ncbi:MAG: N-acyl homoserine lactonase family protein [Robiginitomaculum sp.]|nr:N-acyl homoserine lactonase family protein [Robiginitomaculum sp.]
MKLKLFGALGAMAFLAACNQTSAPAVKLYTIPCGQIETFNLGPFSTGGEYEGQSRNLDVSCHLIRHPKGDLMWDSGLSDGLALLPEGAISGGIHLSVPRTLQSQLEELGVLPEQVEFFAMSHSHFDHTGNANLFAHGPTSWIVDEAEYQWMSGIGPDLGLTELDGYDKLLAKTPIRITEDHDVFGDGSVQIIRTPGHTPGHLALLVKLPNTGNILLTGDLYHLPESREFRRIPVFNTSAEETLASMDKFEAVATAENARVIIQHNKEDIASLPAFPKFAD